MATDRRNQEEEGYEFVVVSGYVRRSSGWWLAVSVCLFCRFRPVASPRPFYSFVFLFPFGDERLTERVWCTDVFFFSLFSLGGTDYIIQAHSPPLAEKKSHEKRRKKKKRFLNNARKQRKETTSRIVRSSCLLFNLSTSTGECEEASKSVSLPSIEDGGHSSVCVWAPAVADK